MPNNQEFELHDVKKRPYFEGWYIRVMQEDISFAVIIGIHYSDTKIFAFIQFMDTQRHQSVYEEYRQEDIQVIRHPFKLCLKDNVLTREYLILQLDEINVNLSFSPFTPLEHNVYMPTIMGPFSYLPMECVHSIISLHHTVSGSLSFASQTIDIQGIGYMEKDRGSSFPSSYLWFQANKHDQKTGVFLSIATIPLRSFTFTGLIAVVMQEGKQYRLATYMGGYVQEMKLYQREGKQHVLITLKQGRMKLCMHLIWNDICKLNAPYEGDMHIKIAESLNSTGFVTLSKGKQIIYEDVFYDAGMEVVGYQ